MVGAVRDDARAFVPYRPVYEDGDRLVESDEPPSAEHRANVKQVLEFYGVPFREAGEAILIPRDVRADRDTVWNYTMKANDPAWLAAHRIEGGARTA